MSGSTDSSSGSQTGSHWLELSAQPSFRLVALMEESISYDRHWVFPFHHFSLCVRDDPSDPSWVEVEDTGERFESIPGTALLIAASTPVRIRYTTKNLHKDIHFRYVMFPGVDVFSKVRGCFRVTDPGTILQDKIAAIFADADPMRRFTRAESVALEHVIPIWPERPPLDIHRLAPYTEALHFICGTVNARTSVRDLAVRMKLPASHFSKAFRGLVGTTPKRWLERALFDRALLMLADKGRTIRDIAYALEFSDEFHFSRFVKHRCGYSPSQLRRAPQGPVVDWN